jgi:uncharacterized membrane protein YfcA
VERDGTPPSPGAVAPTGAGASAASGTTPATARLPYWSPGLGLFALTWLAVWLALFPAPFLLARAHGALVPIGFAVAVVANATAVGGGILFIPIMVFGYGLPPVEALQLSIAAQAFGMTSGALGWLRRGAVPRGALAAALPVALAGATLSALLVHASPALVKAVFGPVSIALGASTLAQAGARAERAAVPPAAHAALRAAAALGGLASGWVAIGAGELPAAYLMLRQRLRADLAIGLGVVLLAATSVWLLVLHVVALDGIPSERALFLVLGCVFGARVGPWLADRVPSATLRRLFGAIAIGNGVLFALQAWRP